MKLSSYLGLLAAFCVFSANATTRYVTPTGAGSKNGTSWTNAAEGSALQAMITASSNGDQVWVAAGTYFTTTGTSRIAAFSMRNGVSIYGSFVGTETTLTQRVLSSGLTSILSGEIGAAGNADNAYHIISNKGLNNSALINGFIITGANDDRPVSSDVGLGGGIYNDGNFNPNNCSPTIQNCAILNNRATFGAGIFNSAQSGGNSSPIVTDCVIAFNHATEGGGAIDNFGLGGTASPTLTNCVIYSNTAALRGGAMYCWGGNNGNANPILLNCAFVNNSAADGGAIVCANNNSGAGNSGSATPVIKNNIFKGNSASGIGPQFFIVGTATFQATYTSIDLTGQTAPHAISGATTGNSNADPKFLNIALGTGADLKWFTNDDGLKLLAGSPCINTGNNTGVAVKDILGNNRIVNTTVDMGPYEYASGSGIGNVSATNDLLLFPNPGNGIVFINGLKSTTTVQVLNSLGAEVAVIENVSDRINLSDIPAGVYVIRFIGKDGSIDKVFMKE